LRWFTPCNVQTGMSLGRIQVVRATAGKVALFLLLSTLSLVAHAERPVAFFPGTFDPPTKNHFNLVVEAIRLKNLEKVYVYVGPHGDKDPNLSSEERAALFQKVFDSHPETAGKVEVRVDFEPPKGFLNLAKEDPNRAVYVLTGADRADPKHTQGAPDNVRFLMFPRVGSVLPDFSDQPKVEVIDPSQLSFYDPNAPVSSTSVRENVAEGKPISHLVDPIVEEEVYRINLYRPLTGSDLEAAQHAYETEARAFFQEFGKLKGLDLSGLEIPPFKSTQTPAARREKLIRWIIDKRSIDFAVGAAYFEEGKAIFERVHRPACDWAGLAPQGARQAVN